MRTEFSVTSADGTHVPCILDEPDTRTDKLVIFVHGLTGNPHEHHYFNAAREFPKHGYAVLRIWLYPGKGGRMLEDCTLNDHAADVTAVLKHVRDKWEKIALIGHSYGGPTILLSEHMLADTVIIWDPTTRARFDSFAEEMKEGIKVGNGMTKKLNPQSAQPYLQHKESDLLSKLSQPTKVIFCNDRYEHSGGEQYFESIPERKELSLIESDHVFTVPGAEEELFEITLNWLEEYI